MCNEPVPRTRQRVQRGHARVRARFGGVALALGLMVVSVACTPDHAGPATPSTDSATSHLSTSSATPSAVHDDALEETMPSGFFRLDPGDEAVFRDGDVTGLHLEEVRVEGPDNTQRVTLSFDRRAIASGSEGIELWAAPVEQARAEGSGTEIPMDGQFLLQVSVPGAEPRPDMTAPDVTVPPGGLVEDVAMTGAFTGFEGGGALYIGLRSVDVEYRLSSSEDPYQVIIELRPATGSTG